MADKLDPFDVAALEKSLGDSAVRLSTLWISFLIFALYIAVAASNVTHHQLLSEEGQIKIPTLDILIPIVPSFIVFPTIFVLFHVYLFTQVVLLAQTAAAYNEAIDRSVPFESDRARVRQRLTNALFAQIFAGSPDEYGRLISWVLQLTVLMTLAVLPAFVLLTFQVAFLPFHSIIVIWMLRLGIVADASIALAMWTIIVKVKLGRDINWRDIVRRWWAISLIAVLYAISLVILSFPGEPQAGWSRYYPESRHLFDEFSSPRPPTPAAFADKLRSIMRISKYDGCATESYFNTILPPNFDRLSTPGEKFVNDEAVAKLSEARKARGLRKPAAYYQSRNFVCANLTGTDFRLADFDYADLQGATLSLADLSGASFYRAVLEYASLNEARLESASLVQANLGGADLRGAQLQGAYLRGVLLRGAKFIDAQLQGADFVNAEVQGADLRGAQLQAADLSGAQLQGADLSFAVFQGADLRDAQLQGADLRFAVFQGADLRGAQLQGADLSGAQLQGADLSDAQLQGADIGDANLGQSVLAKVSIWRARNATCANARIADPRTNNVIESHGGKPIPATPDAIAEFIADSIAQIPDADNKAKVADRMREGLVINPARDDAEAISKVWRTCEKAETSTMPQEKFDEKRAAVLRDLACNESENRKAIAAGIIRNWVSTDRPSVFSVQLARGLLGQDGKECAATKDFDNTTIGKLKERAAATVVPAATPAK
jgi:uncharacterized protein YjbI with pentapeptide repeats